MTNRLAFIDMLRGASILYIVGFWHLMEYTPAFPSYENPITLRVTVTVLGLFVFLSGWLVGQRVIETSKEGVKIFYIKRFLRIYPLYLGAIGLFFICNLSDKTTLLKASMLISMFDGPAPPTLWFITMFMMFLLVAPLLVCAVKHETRFWAVAAIIFGSLALIMRYSTAGDPRVVIYFPAFVCGIYLAQLGLLRLKYVHIFTLIGLVLSIGLSFAVDNFPETSFWSIPLACFAPVSIFLLSWRYRDSVPNARSFGVRRLFKLCYVFNT